MKNRGELPGIHTTLSLLKAMMNGYIGEVDLVPDKISNAVRQATGKRKMRTVRMYYYGTPDKRLSEMFGHTSADVFRDVPF